MTLWGLPMLWWGRIGKGLQFLAGCVVILDLIGPQRLRAIGERAAERRRQTVAWVGRMRELTELAGVKRAITECIMVRQSLRTGLNRFSPPDWAVSETPVHLVPRPDWLEYSDLVQLRSRTLLELPNAHDCGDRHPAELCDQQANYVRNRVDEYVRAKLPRHERKLLDHEDDLRRAERVRIRILVVLMVLFLAMTALRGPFLGVGPPIIALVVWFALCSDGFWLWLRSAPVEMLTKLGATLLERLFPDHRIRWVAFILFVVGFGLDLLAS